MQAIPADFLAPVGMHLNHLYLIVHAVEDLRPGAYVLHRDLWALELLKEGDFRAEAGYLGLEQDLPADASATIFFLADLNAILQSIWQSGLSHGSVGIGDHRREDISCGLQSGFRRHWPDFLR